MKRVEAAAAVLDSSCTELQGPMCADARGIGARAGYCLTRRSVTSCLPGFGTNPPWHIRHHRALTPAASDSVLHKFRGPPLTLGTLSTLLTWPPGASPRGTHNTPTRFSPPPGAPFPNKSLPLRYTSCTSRAHPSASTSSPPRWPRCWTRGRRAGSRRTASCPRRRCPAASPSRCWLRAPSWVRGRGVRWGPRWASGGGRRPAHYATVLGCAGGLLGVGW